MTRRLKHLIVDAQTWLIGLVISLTRSHARLEVNGMVDLTGQLVVVTVERLS